MIKKLIFEFCKNEVIMHLIEANFKDFDSFNAFAVDWELDFKLLSRNNFNAYLHLYANDTFQLGRTSLSGTIHQQGLVPKGFRTIVIPAGLDVNYNWLHKEVNSSNLLIFPKNGILESVSHSGFDVYVLSIEEERLFELLETFGFLNAERMFRNDEMRLFLSQDFLMEFWKGANDFLRLSKKNHGIESEENRERTHSMADQLILKTLKFIDLSNVLYHHSRERRRDVALKKCIEFIQSHSERNFSIKELCRVSQVSERTLEYAFLEKFQINPSQYIKAHKLHLVKKHLTTRKGEYQKISDISSLYGFHHQGQFSHDFKRHFGINPSKV